MSPFWITFHDFHIPGSADYRDTKSLRVGTLCATCIEANWVMSLLLLP